jgi:thiol:disulfide interchange protein DsbD
MIRRLFLAVCLPAVALLVFAAAPGARAQVRASLVCADASVQPGRAFTVALKLEHQPRWHTYWVNAGTGYPTSLAWELPAGWQAGGIRWPVPGLIRDGAGAVTGNGYEAITLLPVTLTPPKDLKPGETVTLRAKASWLMCADVCMPGGATVALTLPVSAGEPAPDAAVTAALAATPMPRATDGWRVSATRGAGAGGSGGGGGKTVVLTIAGAGVGDVFAGAALAGAAPHFFCADELVAFDQPQLVAPAAGGGGDAGSKSAGKGAGGNGGQNGGGFTLTLPLSEDAGAGAGAGARLVGVLAFERADGARQGFAIDVAVAGGTGGASGVGGAGGGINSAVESGDKSPHSKNTGAAAPAGAFIATAAGTGTAAAAAAGGASAGLIGTLLLAFLGGLVLNLMPCVFPVLGIKILGFVNQAGADRRKVALHGVAFTAGVLVSFWLLAGLLLVLRAGGRQLGWGFQLQSPAFVFCMAVLLLVFALNLSGLFEVGLSATSVGGRLQSKGGRAGSFFTGALAVLVATPCSAPFLAPALGAALALGAGESALVFTAIAIGLSAPYLLLSIFPGAVKFLPRPGAWMETFKQLMSFLLYATVGALLWVLAAQTADSDYALLRVLFGFVLVAMAAWVYGRFGQPYGKPARRAIGQALALALLAGGVWLGWPETPAAPAPAAVAGAPPQITWEKWSPDAVAAARAAGKTVYVDFTARWCATCQTNKLLVFKSGEVLRHFNDNGIVTLRADWTTRDPQITAELAKHNRAAVPFNLVYKPGRPEPLVLPEILTPGIVLDAVR